MNPGMNIVPFIPLITDLLRGGLGMYGQYKTNQSNERIAMMNNLFNERMIDKMNAYNTPKAQLERMLEAGLNPYLMYSSGNVGNQSGHVTAEGYSYESPLSVGARIMDVSSGISSIYDTLLKKEELKRSVIDTEFHEEQKRRDRYQSSIRYNLDLQRNKMLNLEVIKMMAIEGYNQKEITDAAHLLGFDLQVYDEDYKVFDKLIKKYNEIGKTRDKDRELNNSMLKIREMLLEDDLEVQRYTKEFRKNNPYFSKFLEVLELGLPYVLGKPK